MSDPKILTTKEVARLCRVSDATVKRWEEAGLLRSERTNGGHRRFRTDEITRFQREMNLGLKQCHGDDSAIKAATTRRTRKTDCRTSLFHTLIAGREEESSEMLIHAFLHGEMLPDIFDGVMRETMTQIGEMWVRGELTIAQEHLATRTLMNALQKLRAIVPVPKMNDKLAMCCAVEGDFHELPTHLIQITLESLGWEVLNFGANTPLFALADEVSQHAPEMVCIASTVMPDLERLSRDYKKLRNDLTKMNVAVVLGGRGFSDENIKQRFPADLHAGSFSELLSFSHNLNKTQEKAIAA